MSMCCLLDIYTFNRGTGDGTASRWWRRATAFQTLLTRLASQMAHLTVFYIPTKLLYRGT
ncbi:hypothetical protein BD626DRAFT_477569 [Schizophyllum amplum]|uniref:Uncharacterized protein n=1 Tax=Schizophyllum amplum TaxID=97359 RepID=A0A550D0B3_9AGAR|nr:hypothetical protein BD626DRAFT_477569 [Auriculariopsis ampla]